MLPAPEFISRSVKMVTANLSETIRFQKRAVATLLREISVTDYRSESLYIREFHNEFKTFETITRISEIVEQAAQSNLVYIGDYHALKESQAFAAYLITSLIKTGRPIYLG